jgi:nitrogen-specific signal transduction histidine kinase
MSTQLMQLFPHDSQLRLGCVPKIERAAQQIQLVVEHMLQFLQPAPGHAQPTHIHDVLDAVLLLMQYRIRAGHTNLIRVYASDLPRIAVNAARLQQAFLTIIVNRLAALSGGGELRIATTLRHDAIEIRITDAGGGAAPEPTAALFPPDLPPSTAGDNLELAICRNIIGQHDGTIQIESSSNGSSTWVVCLPLQQAPAV